MVDNMSMAIYTLGADDIRVKKMVDIAEAWGFGGKYSNPERLLTDAKKEKFSSVLVIDYEALEDKIVKELEKIGIEIISLKDKKKLKRKIEESYTI